VQLVELAMQLRGEAGSRQSPALGLGLPEMLVDSRQITPRRSPSQFWRLDGD